MAVNISATQTVTLLVDNDGDGLIDPGDVVSFHVEIENTGSDDALGVNFTEILDGMTEDGASINVSPIAFADSYSGAGNVEIAVDAASGVLANDVEFLGDTSQTVTAFDALSAQLGTVNVAADGSFTYTSAVGFEGTDPFSYTVTDSGGLATAATVTVTVGPSVWFIDNSAPGSANLGTQADPFTSIAAFNAAQLAGGPSAPDAGDVIYLREGTYNEADGINLGTGQTLVGQGQDLVVNGVTIEDGSSGQTPVISVSGGQGIALASGNAVAGLNVVTTSGSAVAIEDGGATVGTLSISNVDISGSGKAVDIDNGGTLNVDIDSLSSTGSASQAIDLGSFTGSFNVDSGTISGSTGTAVNINGGTGTINIDANLSKSSDGLLVEVQNHSGNNIDFGGTLSSTASSDGLSVHNNSGGSIDFSGATKTLSTGGGTAVSLSSNGGATINFTNGGLDIDTTSATGFTATGGGTINVSGAGNSITSGTGTALNVVSTNIGASDITFQSISSGTAANSTATGIILDTTGSSGGLHITGTGAAGSGGTIQHKTGADLRA